MKEELIKVAAPTKRTFYIEHHRKFGYRLIKVWEAGDAIAFEDIQRLAVQRLFTADVEERIIAEQSVTIRPIAGGVSVEGDATTVEDAARIAADMLKGKQS